MPESRHRIIVVGLGGVSVMWFPTLLGRSDIDLVAVVEIDDAVAAASRATYGLTCDVYRDLADAAAAHGPALIVNLTPPEHHRAVVAGALRLGCDVFGEKPMAASLEEAFELIDIAKETDRTYTVMQQRRYVSGCRTLRDGIANGRIGTPELICVDYFMAPHFDGFRRAMESPLLLDMAIHTFDQVRFVAGFEPVAVYCHEFNPPSSSYSGAAAAVCVFEGADGSVFSYRGSWAAEGSATSWESAWRVIGSRGTASWDGFGPPFAETVAGIDADDALFRTTERAEWPSTYDGPEGHAGCIDAVLSARSLGKRPETDCSDNVKSLSMVFGALESARRMERISMSELGR